MTMTERFANNLLTIVIARAAMIITPFILAAIGWVGIEVWRGLDARISTIEAASAKQSSQIQDHESRLQFTAAQARRFEELVESRFTDLGGTMKDLNVQVQTINGNIIRLQTTIENRLPPRSASREDTK